MSPPLAATPVLSADELKILLMLRRETDCMLLRKEEEKVQKDCPKDTL